MRCFTEFISLETKSWVVHFNRLKPYEGYGIVRDSQNEDVEQERSREDMDRGSRDSSSEETDHHEGAWHLEMLSSSEEDGTECGSIQPVGDDQQAIQYEELASFRFGGYQGVGPRRSARQRRPPQRLGYL